jgi:hypothetical protein
VKCGWVKCSEDLSNRVSNIIRRYIDHMKIYRSYEVCCLMAFSFVTFFYTLLVTLFIILYVFLLLCIFIVMYFLLVCNAFFC